MPSSDNERCAIKDVRVVAGLHWKSRERVSIGLDLEPVDNAVHDDDICPHRCTADAQFVQNDRGWIMRIRTNESLPQGASNHRFWGRQRRCFDRTCSFDRSLFRAHRTARNPGMACPETARISRPNRLFPTPGDHRAGAGRRHQGSAHTDAARIVAKAYAESRLHRAPRKCSTPGCPGLVDPVFLAHPHDPIASWSTLQQIYLGAVKLASIWQTNGQASASAVAQLKRLRADCRTLAGGAPVPPAPPAIVPRFGRFFVGRLTELAAPYSPAGYPASHGVTKNVSIYVHL